MRPIDQCDKVIVLTAIITVILFSLGLVLEGVYSTDAREQAHCPCCGRIMEEVQE